MKSIFVLVLSLIFSHILFSQTLEGNILDEKEEGLEWATVINTSTGEHTHSGPNGYFKLKGNRLGDTLTISFLGYTSKKRTISDLKNRLKIILEVSSISIDEIVIAPEINSLHIFSDINTQINPVNSSQEILTKVPGLFIGQHAGGGKAEQIFLRGFDIDHGTDINITVDGLPVNMVSHSHGQGYADLHFLIPETIENINFDKGSYNAEKGNFNTAGYVDFNTKNSIENNQVKLEIGQFDMQRLLTMFSLANNKKRNAYIAGEHISNEGFFDSPQNFKRTNVFGKYTENLSPHQKLIFTASHFASNWDASGQIPSRSVTDGAINRFGAIDDTEGGQTSRSNLSLEMLHFINDNSVFKNKVFYSKYNFELFSNFTFFLNDAVNGDQIRQSESRGIFGAQSEFQKTIELNRIKWNWKAGIDFRLDESNNNELSRTLNRTDVLSRLQYGNIDESNLGFYFKNEFELGHWTIGPGLRFDYFKFKYEDLLSPEYLKLTSSAHLFSPKLNILYQKSNDLQYYLKLGQGFHSNDTRVVVQQSNLETLPVSKNADIGIIWKPTKNILFNAGLWYLYLDQEFVYVGDEGVVELNGSTTRKGIDLSMRYEILNKVFFNMDANYTLARFNDADEKENRIPLAPDFTLQSSIGFFDVKSFYGSLNYKYLDNRPANEDNSIVAKGYGIFDLNLGYKWDKINLGFSVQNLLNSEWNETQFATTSRLQNEAAPVEEIHFTLGTPFNMRASISVNF